MASVLAGEACTYGDISLAERTATQVQLFRTRDSGCDARIVDALGFTPGEAVGSVAGDAPKALTIGPGRWLLVADSNRLRDQLLWARLDAAGLRAVDLSHSRIIVRVSGEGSERLLEKGCGLDFDGRNFPPGHCAASLLSHFSCLFHRLGSDSFDLYLARSFAVSAWEWLCESAQSR